MRVESMLEWAHPDARRRVAIWRLANGFFLFEEETLVTDDETEFGGGIYDYWRATHISGLYPSVLDAQNGARGDLPWLGELLDEMVSRS